MREIRMKSIMVGPNVSRHPGERCTVSAEEAETLINQGYAEAVATPAENRQAENEPAAETTVSPETGEPAAVPTATGSEPAAETTVSPETERPRKGGKK